MNDYLCHHLAILGPWQIVLAGPFLHRVLGQILLILWIFGVVRFPHPHYHLAEPGDLWVEHRIFCDILSALGIFLHGSKCNWCMWANVTIALCTFWVGQHSTCESRHPDKIAWGCQFDQCQRT